MSSPNDKPQKRGRLKEDPDQASKPKKRQCLPVDTTILGNATYPNFLMNSDVASEIFSFLDIRSLYNVTMTSKESMKLLRHEHVVRSAMMQGGHSKTCMERLVALIEKRCIWIPSPIRMLRLVNGKTCERCNRGKVHLVSENYGVFFCFHGCIQDTSTKGVAFNQRWSPYLVDQPRIAKSAYSSSAYLWIRPYTSNERCGPLISMTEIEQVMLGHGTVESLLKEKDALDPHANAVSDIVKVFKDSTDAAHRRIQETKRKKIRASVDANERRKKKIVAMIYTLMVELDDVPWKDVVLEYRWIKSNSKDVPHFECNLTNELMREYGNAPSKATKKKLKEVANSLRQSFAVLERRGFHDFSFLSDADPVERAVKQYSREKGYGGYKLLQSHALDNEAIDRIRDDSGDNALKEFLGLVRGSVTSMLAPAIVSSAVAIQDEALRKKAIMQVGRLADSELGKNCSLFMTSLDSDRDPTMTPLHLYNVCVEKYPKLFQNTIDFLKSPETFAWKQEHGQGYGRYPDPAAATKRLECLLNRIWEGPTTTYEPLFKRDFKAVLKIIWDEEGKWQAALNRF